jgi:uncharacterized RDD family membrane protein YckC
MKERDYSRAASAGEGKNLRHAGSGAVVKGTMCEQKVGASMNDQLNRASARRRILAAVIDLVILWIGGSVLAYIIVSLFGKNIEYQWQMDAWEGLVLMIFWLIYSSFEIITAASPAKMLLGMRIAYLDGRKAPLSLLVLRWSTKYLPQMLLIIYLLSFNGLVQLIASIMNAILLIGCLQMLDEEKRSWLDQWAHTSVVRKSDDSAGVLVTDTPLQQAKSP